MDLNLAYLVPGRTEPIEVKSTITQEPLTLEWLYRMVASNPDTIFFYTTPTTDIFED